MSTLSWMLLLGLVVCGGASFGFALAETALFTLGKWQTRELAERHPVAGGRVAQLLAGVPDLLATITLGNSLANAGLVALAVWLVEVGDWPGAATLMGALVVILVGGEVVPKTLAVRFPEFWALRVARPLALMQRVTRPIRLFANALNAQLVQRIPAWAGGGPGGTAEDEVAELVELGIQQGALAQGEKEIILQIISLDRRMAKDVMKPRAQMAALPDDLPVAEMVAAARRLKHRRIPLYDRSLDAIVGILNTRKLLLAPDADLSEAVEFPSFVPETMNLLRLLQSLQRQRRGLAIVVDEYGSTAGLVTAEDILGAMVGRIRGEGEGEGFVMERLGAGRWRVNGSMRVADFRREYPALGDWPGTDTMGGLMTLLTEVVPPVGARATVRGLQLTCTVADERRVRELLVEAGR